MAYVWEHKDTKGNRAHWRPRQRNDFHAPQHFSFLFKRAVANQTKHDASPTKATWANRKLMRSAQQRCILLQTPLYPESPIYIGEMCAEIEESQLKGTRKEQHDLKKLGVCVSGACVCVCVQKLNLCTFTHLLAHTHTLVLPAAIDTSARIQYTILRNSK